jgi:PAS domain S-box-containing protein
VTEEETRAEEIRSRYAAIVESSDDAIIAKTLDGVISAWNAAAERMFGYAEREAIGQPIAMIVPPDLYGEEPEILRRLRAGERIQHYETVRVTKAGERIDVSLTISPLRDSAGRIIGCSKIARDITKAKALQSISTRLMSESTPESLYAQILAAAMELMASDCASVQMLAADHASLWLLAWKNFHPDSAAFWECVEVGAGSTCSKALTDNERVVVADIEACYFMAGTQDQHEYRRSGIRAVQSTPLRSRSGRPLGMLSTHWRAPHHPTEEDFRFFDVLARQAADLIERTLAEEALSAVSQKLIEAHEEERTRIARELHDDVGQRLTLVSMRLGYLTQGPLAPATDVAAEIGDVRQQIGDLAADIQALSHDLHSPKLDFLGLPSAVTGFCDELSHRSGVAIDVRVENIPDAVPPDVSLCLYRVLQEALQNVVKHSESRYARVSLNGRVDTIDLTVEDSGAGFDPPEAMRGRGLGLTSMKERLKIVGGQLSIQSEPGCGATIHASAPLRVLAKPANVLR